VAAFATCLRVWDSMVIDWPPHEAGGRIVGSPSPAPSRWAQAARAGIIVDTWEEPDLLATGTPGSSCCHRTPGAVPVKAVFGRSAARPTASSSWARECRQCSSHERSLSRSHVFRDKAGEDNAVITSGRSRVRSGANSVSPAGSTSHRHPRREPRRRWFNGAVGAVARPAWSPSG